MGYRHDRSSILDAAVDHVAAISLDDLTFGKLAASMGIADRTIVYYFPWKAKLIEAVVEQIILDFLVYADSADDDDVPATVGTYLEILGRAAAGGEPYASVMRRLRGEWSASGGDVRVLAGVEGSLIAERLQPGGP